MQPGKGPGQGTELCESPSCRMQPGAVEEALVAGSRKRDHDFGLEGCGCGYGTGD